MRKLSRRQFGKWALRGGILVPFVPGIVKARGTIIVNSYRYAAAAGGSAPTLVSTATLNTDLNADDPESFSITTGAITNGCVVAYFTHLKSNYVSSCTFDGVAMTALAQITDAATSTIRAEIWGLKLATKGAGTYTIAPSGTSGGHFKGIANTWNGVNQTTPFGTGVTATGVSTAPSVNITSGATDIVVACCAMFGTWTFTAGSGYSVIANDSTVAEIDHLSQYKQAASVANATASGSSDWCIGAVAITP